MSTFGDRTLVVSGGSRSIGLAIALGAAKQGANVVLLAKTAEPHPKPPGTVFTAVAEIEEAGGKGVGREFSQERAGASIGFSCLWPETHIATSAVANMADGELMSSSRSPEIMADAAVEILSRAPRDVNGQCFIDSAVLTESGVSDLSRYGGGDDPILDIFVDKS